MITRSEIQTKNIVLNGFVHFFKNVCLVVLSKREQAWSSIQNKMLMYTKTIFYWGQAPKSRTKVLFQSDFVSWCPLLLCKVLTYRISR